MIMARKITKNGRTKAYAAPYWRRLAAVTRGRRDAESTDGAFSTAVDMGAFPGAGRVVPAPVAAGTSMSGDREALVFGVLDGCVLPGLQSCNGVGLVGECLAEGLVEVRVDVIHEGQPAEVGTDRLRDLGKLLVHLLAAVEVRLLVDEGGILQDLVQRREQVLLGGELERGLLVGVDEQGELGGGDLVLAELEHGIGRAAPVAGHGLAGIPLREVRGPPLAGRLRRRPGEE